MSDVVSTFEPGERGRGKGAQDMYYRLQCLAFTWLPVYCLLELIQLDLTL